ncbi:MAG: hypothetical protein ABIA97_01830 [Candidatus Omnitrophota bacterium]
MKKLLIVTIFCLLIVPFCLAETIELKSGKTRTGDIVERTDEYIKLEIGGVPVTYYLDEIKS